MKDSGRVVGVVLAAGLSTRLGRPKQLVPLAGRALVWHTTRALLDAEPTGGVLVVTPPGPLGEQVRAALAGLDVTLTENVRPDLGISESFRAAIRALPPGTDAANFVLGDMPLVTAAMQARVLAAYAQARPPLVLARFGPEGVRAPPHVFRSDLFPHFSQQGDHGPRHVIREYAGQAVWVDLPLEALRDVDTPQDVAGMQATFGS